MPRYFFDSFDGERAFRDETGIDLQSTVQLGSTARDLLLDLGQADVAVGVDRLFVTVVRDDQGTTVFQASMLFKVDTLQKAPTGLSVCYYPRGADLG